MTEHIEINSRKEAIEYASKCIDTWVGAAEAGDTNVMTEMYNRFHRVHRAVTREITDSARLVDGSGKPIKDRSLGRFEGGELPDIKKH